jgi:hypothetical protein
MKLAALSPLRKEQTNSQFLRCNLGAYLILDRIVVDWDVAIIEVAFERDPALECRVTHELQCSGQQKPDCGLDGFSAFAGGTPSLKLCGLVQLY